MSSWIFKRTLRLARRSHFVKRNGGPQRITGCRRTIFTGSYVWCYTYLRNHHICWRVTGHALASSFSLTIRGVVPLTHKYGYNVSCFEDYVADVDKFGSMLIEACDSVMAVALAQDIRSSIIAEASFNPENQLRCEAEDTSVLLLIVNIHWIVFIYIFTCIV